MTAAKPGMAAQAESEQGAAKAPAPLVGRGQTRLAGAAERRAREATRRERELNGRGGLDPVRYGDWEVRESPRDF